MINVFIDSNIWLSLYDFSNDDIDKFGEFYNLIGKEIRLILPQQVFDEVIRNRENKIKKTLDDFKLGLKIPNMCKGHSDYDEFSKKLKEVERLYKEIIQAIKKDTKDNSLKVDEVIYQILGSQEKILTPIELINLAQIRYKTGNPPGKNNKYGDAINWEILLKFAPDGEDLYFVSGDKDYGSVLDKTRMNNFLEQEWKFKKKSNIHFYTTLTDFLKSHVKTIELISENKKVELISQLRESRNFSETHYLIGELDKYTNWSENEISELCEIANINSQVNWILGDEDVNDFYTLITDNYLVLDDDGFFCPSSDDDVLKTINKLRDLANAN